MTESRFVVGVTGSIGAGKTSLVKLLERELSEGGEEVVRISADEVVSDLFEVDRKRLFEGGLEQTAIFVHLVKRFGREVVTQAGELDRKLMASRAFRDRASADAINEIIHPHVIKRTEELLEGFGGVALLDVPLLFESGMDKMCDMVVVVAADVEIRANRAARFQDVRKREKLQMPQEEKIRRADEVVRNDGSLDELAEKARVISEKILTRRNPI